MVLEVTNTIDDIVAFNRYHFAASPEIRETRRRQSRLLLLMFAALSLSLFAYTRSPFLALAIFGGGVAGLILPKTLLKGRSSRRRDECVRRLFANGANDSIFGVRRLSLLEDRIEEESASARSSFKYEALGPVTETADHVFLYVNSQNALVIPKKDVAPNELDAFIRALRDKLPPNPVLQRIGSSLTLGSDR